MYRGQFHIVNPPRVSILSCVTAILPSCARHSISKTLLYYDFCTCDYRFQYLLFLGLKTYTIILVGGVVVASEVIWQLYKRLYCRWKRDSKIRETPETNISESGLNISKVMFFRKQGTLCRAHSNRNYTKACLNSYCPAKYLR